MINRTTVIPLPLEPRRQSFGARLQNWFKLEMVWLPTVLAIHVALGIAFSSSALLATLHFGAVALTAVWVFTSSFSLARMAYVAAYITGAETLWRMSRAAIPWETAKFTVAGLLVLSLLRTGRLRGPVLPFLFFLLLLPSAVLPLANLSWGALRQELSFNLGGPFALAICLWFFSNVKLTTQQLQRLFLAGICPALSVAAFALYGIVTAPQIVFTHGSNAALSGGFGPAQVSATLGLGVLLCFLWAMDRTVSRMLRGFLLALMLFLLVQCALTFSRGGLYMALGGALTATLFMVRDNKLRLRLCASIAALAIVINFFVLPGLDRFTQGKLTGRLQDAGVTGRDALVMGDLQVFYDHLLFGVGPGQTGHFRPQQIQFATIHAHTEFSRLLSEHGLFGAAALFVLILICAQNILHAQTSSARGVVAALLVWSIVFMFSLAMRLVAPSFAFGLSAVSLVPTTDTPGNKPARKMRQ